MAYTKKVPAVATAVLFLAAVIAPLWTEAQSSMPKLDPVCAIVISDIVQICYLTGSLVPSEECCKDLKSASTKQVSCICDNIVAHPSTSNNLTEALFTVVHTTCGVGDKFTCKGGDANGGATNKIAASMGLFGLVASLFF